MASKSARNKIKLAILVLILIVGVLTVGSLINFTKSLFTPFSKEESKKGFWDGNTQINLVLKTHSVSLLSFDPSEQTIKVVTVPGETYVELPDDFGSWQVTSVYDLGQGENPARGVYFLKTALTSYLGLPIDGFMTANFSTPEEAIALFRNQPTQLLSKLPSLNTDLTPLELIRLYIGFRGVRFDKITYVNLDTNMDDFVAKNLFDSQLHQTQVSVAVFNGTKLPGKAKEVARLVSNLGGNVIISNNFELDNIKHSFIFPKKGDYASQRLGRIFTSDCSEEQICDKLKDELYSRAQINIVIGEDFF